MTLLTALELANNYPENILITAAKHDNCKFSIQCYRTKEGQIHKIMLSSEPVYDTEQEALNAMHNVAKKIVKEYKTVD